MADWEITTSSILNEELDTRIRSAYRLAVNGATPGDESIWSGIFRINQDVHDALMTATEGPLALRDPASSNLAYGFDNLAKSLMSQFTGEGRSPVPFIDVLERDIRTLAQAIGIKRVTNPEGGGGYIYNEPLEALSISDIVSGLRDAFGAPIEFPTPFPSELGLVVSGGIASQRTMPAIYQAWRLKCLAALYGGRVVEIGAGFGRTAYYAVTAAALTDYTIIDLPLTNAAQATFLGRTLGPNQICLYGETYRPGHIRIMPTRWFTETPPSCDVVLNVDSLTEMPISDARAYADWAMRSAKVLLSMNHEANEFVVRDLPALKARCIGRFPLMTRAGYVEEIFTPRRSF